MSKLRYSNEDCESRTEGQMPCFSVNLAVDDDGSVSEPVRKIPGKFFECVFCHSEAEWGEG